MPSLKEQWEATPLWQRMVVAVVLPLVGIGAIWFYMIKPETEKRDRLIRDREQLKQEIAKYKKLIRPGALKRLEEELEKLKKEEEKKKKELENVVGKIPRKEEIEQVFGELNFVASSQGLLITKISLSSPRVQNFQLVEKGDKKFVKVVSGQQQEQRRRVRGRANRRGKPKKRVQPGVPVTTLQVAMKLQGRTENVYRFLEKIYEKGLVSYPRSLKIEPLKGKNIVDADVVIDVILQK